MLLACCRLATCYLELAEEDDVIGVVVVAVVAAAAAEVSLIQNS